MTEDSPVGALGDVAADLHAVSQLIAALYLAADRMGSQEPAMRFLEWLVADKAEELDRLTDTLRAGLNLPPLGVARCEPRQ